MNVSFPVLLSTLGWEESAECRRQKRESTGRSLWITLTLPKAKNTQPSLTLHWAAAWLAASTLVPR